MFELGMVAKEILSCLFNPFILKILDLYLETWLWLPYVQKKPFTGEWIYGITQKHTLLTILFIFNTFIFSFFFSLFLLLLSYCYFYQFRSLLPLFSLLKLILSSILPLLFITILYYFYYFINSFVYHRVIISSLLLSLLLLLLLFLS